MSNIRELFQDHTPCASVTALLCWFAGDDSACDEHVCLWDFNLLPRKLKAVTMLDVVLFPPHPTWHDVGPPSFFHVMFHPCAPPPGGLEPCTT